jgi:cell division protease FtsH
MREIEASITRVMIGPEKKSRVVSQLDNKLVAYHESGHAIVAYMLPNCDKVSEVSIIPGLGGRLYDDDAHEECSFVRAGS